MTSMKLALTGATGFIGSHVLTDLQEHGHDVTALVRNDSDADAVAARGATSLVVDLYNRPAVVRALSQADGAIHTASPGDETSADLDAVVVDAAIEAFAGTGKPYLHITGAWVYGENTHISEESRSMRRRWSPGRNRSLSVPSMRAICGESSSPPVWPTAMAAEAFPGCCSAHRVTTPAT